MAKRIAVSALVAGALLVALWLHRAAGVEQAAEPAASPREAPSVPRVVPASQPGGHLRYVAVGGGADPESTELSLEQDMQLAARVLPQPGALLFGGGAEGRPVRVLDPALAQPGLLAQLGELFQPRLGRQSRYRQSELPSRAASLPELEATLTAALAPAPDPLLLYVASHGEQGERAADNYAALWGGQALTVRWLAKLHDANPRPLRVVAASCFSGGFAELAFRGADAERGPADAPRCGLFAGTWDRQTTGCDPDPDRRQHEGYSLHFLSALDGRDRHGRPLPSSELDLDGDGAVSLLEAHVHAVLASHSIDVPTTTSERLLRWFDVGRARAVAALVPEETRVVEVLGAELGLPDAQAAQRRWQELDRQLAGLEGQLDDADGALADAAAALGMRLLARWPVLDDPYHPAFAGVLDHDAAAIERVLRSSPEAEGYADAQARVARLEQQLWTLQLAEARVLRLVRAHETCERAAALKARGGADWRAYQRVLACERWVPGAAGAAAGSTTARKP